MSVTGDSAISEAFARDVRESALQAIARYAPSARPMTVSLVLDSAKSGVTVTPGASRSSQFRTLLGAGTNVAQEGAVPTVPIQPASIAGDYAQSYIELRGTYSIADANGRVLEAKPLQVSSNANAMDGELSVRRDLAMRTGEFVAMRVQALSR